MNKISHINRQHPVLRSGIPDTDHLLHVLDEGVRPDQFGSATLALSECLGFFTMARASPVQRRTRGVRGAVVHVELMRGVRLARPGPSED
ncbi:hypothetical protein QE152_g15472 [Popillia japonica]|uniref:Uncharacterized protein n=1 Tax=Popillia japonica TaxID=7064 RepID=A0AAW1L849_POPJA